jgi:putative ABC transport system permease protein
MTRLVLRGLMERRLRSVLTALAIVLGVAMIAGAFVQTDAMNRAFGDIENTAYKGVSAVVTPRTAFRSQYYAPKPFSASLVDRIRGLPGVRFVRGDISEMGQLVVHGKAVNNTFAPSLVISTAGAEFGQIQNQTGRMPRAGDEVVIDVKTAADQGIKVGDTAGVAARTGLQRVRVVGTVTFGGVDSIGGATLIFAPLSAVQRWYGVEGQVTSVIVGGGPGVSPQRLVSEVQPLLSADLQVRTGEAQASKETKDTTNAIGA